MKNLIIILIVFLAITGCVRKQYTKEEKEEIDALVEYLIPDTCGWSWAGFNRPSQYWCADPVQQNHLNSKYLHPSYLYETSTTKKKLVEKIYDCRKKKCRFDVPERLIGQLGYQPN